MSYTRRIIMAQKGVSNDMAEVYAYAQSVGITPQQVNAALANKPATIREKLIAWKYLLHSLVDTGYTPWLKGDGVAYINTGIVPNNGYAMEIKFLETEDSKCLVGSRATKDDNGFILGYRSAGENYIYRAYGGSSTRFRITFNYLNSVCTLALLPYVSNNRDMVVVKANSSSVHTLVPDTFTNPKQIYLYTWNNNDVPDSRTSLAKVEYLKIWQGYDTGNRREVWHAAPYLNNGTYGMLDLVTGTFYGSAVSNGLFTYVLEDANGNQVNLQ